MKKGEKPKALQVPGSGSGVWTNLPEDKIAERMKKRREELRLNYEELARLTAEFDAPEYKKGLTPAMLARYEKGLGGKPVLPGARELRLLCSALLVRADWLLLGIDHKAKEHYATEIADLFFTLLSRANSYKKAGQSITAAEVDEHAEKLQRVRRSKGTP
ncbi:MAG: helix-turn-helix transcriptional regulator [Burkholderiales bacterium]